jgi:hypothetical protein
MVVAACCWSYLLRNQGGKVKQKYGDVGVFGLFISNNLHGVDIIIESNHQME